MFVAVMMSLKLATVPVAAIVSPAPVATVQPAPTRSAIYCARTRIVASRVVKQVCQTRKAWLDGGFDPLAEQD